MSLTVKPSSSVLFVTVKSINPSLNGGVNHVPVLREHVESQKKTNAVAQKAVPQHPVTPPSSFLFTKSPTVLTDRVRSSESEKENQKVSNGPRLVRTTSEFFSKEYILQIHAAMHLEDEKEKSKSTKLDKVFKEHIQGTDAGKALLREELRLKEGMINSFDTSEKTKIPSATSQGRVKYYKGRKPEKLLPY